MRKITLFFVALFISMTAFAANITATWSIEEGATLESFSEATITFTGVDAATTTSMYPACFYKVAEDGTTALVENYCTAGVLDRTATGTSIKLWVDEETGCYEGKITAGNYRIVLSAGMVKFNNDNSNKNTEEYVLNFSIAGSDEPALEEIDAVYTVNPENNANVTEIREIVLNFTDYETISVAELDLNTGANIPQFTKYDADFDLYQPCGYIFFKADSLTANGLRLYIPSEFMGTDAIAVEGQYQIVIPAGVVTFADGISKAITLNYIVKAEEVVEPTTPIVEGTKLYVQFPTAYSVLQSSVTFGKKATGGKLSPVKRGMSIGGGTIGGGTTTGTAMTKVDAENGVWEVVAPAGTSDSIFSVVFSMKGYTTACNIADLKYDGEHNLFTLSSDFTFDIRRGGTATEANGTWGVYPFPEPNVITAIWSIEEGAELESFAGVTVTFSGVDSIGRKLDGVEVLKAVAQGSSTNALFYSVAEDGTRTPVAGGNGLMYASSKTEDGVISINYSVANKGYTLENDSYTVPGNYCFVIDAGDVLFTPNRSGLPKVYNDQEYVLNFSIKGSVAVVEAIDAQYSVDPENNAELTEIREVVVTFSEYDSIIVKETVSEGANWLVCETEVTTEQGAMWTTVAPMKWEAVEGTLNALRIYVAADMFGEEAVTTEGAYRIIIPEGVVYFSETPEVTTYNKAITLNYTVKAAPAEPEAISIADFLTKEVNAEVWYELTGVVSAISNTTYGNFDLIDETGTVYVYGLTATQVNSNDKSFATLGLENGDTLTLRGVRADFNGTAQVGGPAYYVSHKDYVAPEVVLPEGQSQETIDFTPTDVYANAEKLTVVDGTNISLTFAQNSGGTAPAWYTSGTAARLYGQNSLTVVAKEGYVLVSVQFVIGNKDIPSADNSTVTNGTYNYDTHTWTATEGADVTEMVLTNTKSSGHFRIQKVIVTLQEKVESAIIEGKVKRALQTGTASIILTHEEDGTAHIYSVDNETWFVTELSQEGVIARDPENVGDYLAISDIALTEDGKLVACNYIRCQFNDDSVESGYKRGTLNVYIWNDLAGAPSIWFQSKASSNSLKSDQGYTMAVKGTSANAKVLVSGVHNSHRGVRMSRFNVIDGQFVDTKDGAGALPYYYYIGSNFKGASAGVDAAVYNEAAHGVNIQFNASSLVDTAWIFDAELVEPSEFLDKGTNGAEVVVNANIAEGTFGKKYNGASYLKVGERLIMAAPYANEEGLLAGVKVLDITNGFAEAVELNAKVDLEEAVEATSAAVTIVADVEGFMTAYLFADSKLYVLAVEEPVITEMEAKNAYAYDVKVEANEDKTVATVSYRLNAPAVAVKVYAKVEGEVVREVEGTTLCRYADGVADNLNIVEVSLEGLSGNVSFEVAVEGTLVETPTEVAKNYRFYHPKGVDVDVNPESEFFGRAYVTEGMPVAKDGTVYIADVNGNGVGQGLYAFDATLAPIANKEGKYGFAGGLTYQEYTPFVNPNNGKLINAYDPCKVRLSEDGRLFMSRQAVGVSPLVEVNPADLDANFTEIFTDFIVDTTTYNLNTADGLFMVSINNSFDVRGEGENLKLLIQSINKNTYSAAFSGCNVNVYNLGEAIAWNTVPSDTIEALTGKYTISYGASAVEYDNEGGIWYCQYRGTPKETEPALIHVNAQGVEDYKNTTIVARQGGIRLNAEGTLLAVAGNNGKKCTIFEVGKDAEGKPTLTAKYEFDTNIGNNLNDIAWDYANNLYLVGNSGEYLKVFALPRESAVVTTPAAERYAIQMPLPMEVEFENIAAIYEMGMWDMAYYESYSNYEVVALLKSQPTVVDKVVTSGMMGGNMNNYYLNDGTGVIVLQAEGDRYEPITDENWDVIGWDTIAGLNIEVGKKLPVDFMANIDFKVVTDEETWLPTGEVYGAPVMTFVPKATGDVIVDEDGWETIVTESNEEFAARCEASDFVEEAVEANIDDVLANRINYAGKLLTLNAEAKYYAESNPYMGTMSAYMYWDAEEAFEVETYEEDGSTIVYVSPKYTEDYNNFAGKLFNVNGEELPEAAFDANVTIDVVKARFDWNSIAQGQTLVVKEYEVKVPGGPVDVENGELVVNIYSNNGSVYVETEAGAMIEVYTVNGLRVYAGVSNTNTTVINGLNTNIAIIRVNGETYKVFVK